MQSGSRTLKDAMNEALRDWVANVDDTFYCIGSAAGPHPYPAMVRDFQCVIGEETRDADAGARKAACRIRWWPASAAAPTPSACSIPSSTTARSRSTASKRRATAWISPTAMPPRSPAGTPGVLHGNRTYLLLDDDGQILEAHSISAGLDYPGIGPEHAG